jgi:pyridoxine 5-phosphate synthase
LFIDPDRRQVAVSKDAGADMIEIHTGEYAGAGGKSRRSGHARRIATIAAYASRLGLAVNAGHGLDYSNIGEIAGIDEIEEVSIGHAIIVRAMEVGFAEAVREMVKLVRKKSSVND